MQTPESLHVLNICIQYTRAHFHWQLPTRINSVYIRLEEPLVEHDFRSQYFVFSQHIPSKVLLVRAVRIEATIVVFLKFLTQYSRTNARENGKIGSLSF